MPHPPPPHASSAVVASPIRVASRPRRRGHGAEQPGLCPRAAARPPQPLPRVRLATARMSKAIDYRPYRPYHGRGSREQGERRGGHLSRALQDGRRRRGADALSLSLFFSLSLSLYSLSLLSSLSTLSLSSSLSLSRSRSRIAHSGDG